MKIIAKREVILAPLQAVIGVVERRQTMPILANVLLAAKGGKLSITATDLEVELVASSEVDVQRDGEVTVPGRKLLDICRALPEGAEITLTPRRRADDVRAKRSRFTLSTLPASEFPTVEEINAQQTLKVAQKDFKRLLDKTHFSMAQQDVRYYLNGMLLETSAKMLRTVATDGHRLALCEIDLPEGGNAGQQVIIPRKGVAGIAADPAGRATSCSKLAVGANHVRVTDRRSSLHIQADRWPISGVLTRHLRQSLPRSCQGGARRFAAGTAACSDPLEREVPRHPLCLEAECADDPGAQPGAGRGGGRGRGRLRRARSSRSDSTSTICSMPWRRSTRRKLTSG